MKKDRLMGKDIQGYKRKLRKKDIEYAQEQRKKGTF